MPSSSVHATLLEFLFCMTLASKIRGTHTHEELLCTQSGEKREKVGAHLFAQRLPGGMAVLWEPTCTVKHQHLLQPWFQVWNVNENRMWWFANPFSVEHSVKTGYLGFCNCTLILSLTPATRLETEDTNCWSFDSDVLFHSCMVSKFTC